MTQPPCANWSLDMPPDAYARLRAVARSLMRAERLNHTLTPTELVHEAVMRHAAGTAAVSDSGQPRSPDFRLTMQRVLVDHARSKARHKRRRGSEDRDPDSLAGEPSASDFETIRVALQRLRAVSPERAEVWEQHYLSGCPSHELALARGVTQRAVQLWLRAANAFLRACLHGG